MQADGVDVVGFQFAKDDGGQNGQPAQDKESLARDERRVLGMLYATLKVRSMEDGLRVVNAHVSLSRAS